MMTDVEIAKARLNGHSICLCKNDEILTDDGKGIAPMMRLIAEGRDLSGYSVADVIVGKAAAMLFVRSGIRAVYGEVTSQAGYAYLKARHIPCAYGTLTDKIINRKGDGLCPMEQAVAETDDPEEGYIALKERLAQLQKGAAHV